MKIVKYVILGIVLVYIGFNFNKVTDKIADFINIEPRINIMDGNIYKKNDDFLFVKNSKDFVPYSKQDLLDIFYTVLNNGYDEFTFYCPNEYDTCIKDVEGLSDDSDTLSVINNYVNPFNSFKNIRILYSSGGEVTIKVIKLYSSEEEDIINKKLDELMEKNFDSDDSLEDKILFIHDYIVNNSKYDKAKKDDKSVYHSNTAYGPLLEGYAICSGYSDVMAIFLDRLNIPNYRIQSSTHVWNALKLDDKWYHLDLTWDDPIIEGTDENTLLHKFYLIDTKTLESYKIEDHEFDKTIYREVV